MSQMFEPIRVGDLTLPNRIVMAPLTRSRAGHERIPNDLMREYYVQRAQAGLILSEATSVAPMGVGYADTPGIWSEAQTQAWKKVVEGVHAAGGRIFLQLWHVGRISDPMFLGGNLPVAPSALKPQGHVSLVRPLKTYVTPKALTKPEIKEIVMQYQRGAANALRAGFDGVEIHAANGYLIDQFLQSGTNHRNDEYGGTVENRARFLLEVTDAILQVWSPGRVGVHLAPKSDSHDMSDANPRETFGYAARELGKRNIAFLFTRERQGPGYLTPHIKKEFKGRVIANEGLTKEVATRVLRDGDADLVSFGKLAISNPDLVYRLENDLPLTKPNTSTFYAKGSVGYTDYPSASKSTMSH